MKTCEFCRTPYGRRPTEAYWQYEARRFCSRPCANKAREGEDRLPNERFKSRYRQVKTADGRRILEHRWVMEQAIGRPLERWEQVHHRNHDGLDNRIENLELVTSAEHGLRHTVHEISYQCVVCTAEFVPHKTKRGRQQTCGRECRGRLISRRNAERRRAMALDAAKVTDAIADRGWKSLNTVEREAAVASLRAQGLNDAVIGERLGTTGGGVATVRIRLGLNPVNGSPRARRLLDRAGFVLDGAPALAVAA